MRVLGYLLIALIAKVLKVKALRRAAKKNGSAGRPIARSKIRKTLLIERK